MVDFQQSNMDDFFSDRLASMDVAPRTQTKTPGDEVFTMRYLTERIMSLIPDADLPAIAQMNKQCFSVAAIRLYSHLRVEIAQEVTDPARDMTPPRCCLTLPWPLNMLWPELMEDRRTDAAVPRWVMWARKEALSHVKTITIPAHTTTVCRGSAHTLGRRITSRIPIARLEVFDYHDPDQCPLVRAFRPETICVSKAGCRAPAPTRTVPPWRTFPSLYPSPAYQDYLPQKAIVQIDGKRTSGREGILYPIRADQIIVTWPIDTQRDALDPLHDVKRGKLTRVIGSLASFIRRAQCIQLIIVGTERIDVHYEAALGLVRIQHGTRQLEWRGVYGTIRESIEKGLGEEQDQRRRTMLDRVRFVTVEEYMQSSLWEVEDEVMM